MRIAVKQNGFSIHFAAASLKADREIVLAAVMQDGRALPYATDRQDDALLVHLAKLKNRGARNWHLLRVKFWLPKYLARWCATAADDCAYFAPDGTAVMAGRGAAAAKRKFEEM